MGRPSGSDPDLDKGMPKPAPGGRPNAHQRQNPNRQTPQRPAQNDLRIKEEGDEPKKGE